MDKETLRAELLESWDALGERLCVAKRGGSPAFSLAECHDLIERTKAYFRDLPLRGTMSNDDGMLYAAASFLRFFPLDEAPESQKESIAQASKEIQEMFLALESVAK